MSLSRNIKRRFPLLAGFAVEVASFGARLGRRHPPQHWAAESPEPRERASIGDVPTGFFLRLALEIGYREVIEIGTHDGARISTLKRLAPHLEAYGLDIGPRFATAHEANGVTFGHYAPEWFARAWKRPLLIGVQTLVCMEADQAAALVASLAQHGVDAAIWEPLPLFEVGAAAPIDRTLTGNTGWYHDYPSLFARAGFRDGFGPGERAWTHTAHHKTLEHVRPFYWLAPEARRS